MVSKIITWIKANLMLVICGSLSLLSITAIVLGMVLPDIQQRLDADKSVYSSLETAGSKAANEHGIEELRSKQAEQQRDLKRFLDSASSFKSSPKALLKWKNGDANMLFPQPVPNEPKASDYFLEAAVAQRREFLSKLNANDKPSESDIREYKEALEKIRQRERIERGESPTPKVGMSQPMGAGAGVGAGAKGGFGGNVPGAGGVGGIGGASGAQASEERTGASIQQAHKTY
ncbi:MAG: hypothetical protein FWC56_00815, partial [Phycisphaerae bacterium]|nr:hypothetical protein [Phycisphaerae bacterium]